MSDPNTYQEAVDAGMTALRQGDSREGVLHLKRALRLAADNMQMADALALLGRAYSTTGDHRAAEEALQEALRRASGSPAALARTKMQMGVVRWHGGQLDAAKYFLQEAEVEFKRQGDARNRSVALGNLGTIMLTRGEYQEAVQTLHTSIEVFESLNELVGVAVQSSNLGEAYYELGDLDGAQTLFERAVRLGELLGSESMQADPLRNLGMVAAARGNTAEALHTIERALNLAETYHQSDIALQCRLSLAEVYLMQNDCESAQTLAAQLLQESDDVPARQAHARLLIGRCQLARREFQRALLTLEAGLVDAQVSASKLLVLRLHAALAQVPGHAAIARVHRRVGAEIATQIANSLLDPALRETFTSSPLYRSVRN